MMVGTHSLLPVCACLVVDKVSQAVGRPRMFTGRSLCLIGAFGMMPDIFSPHLSLESRHASFSHTLWFLIGLAPLMPLVRFLPDKASRLPVALACWLAAALHLATDAVSGGIAWLHPWRDEVLGAYWIEPQYWIWSDAGFILLVWFIYRVLPHFNTPGVSRKAS